MKWWYQEKIERLEERIEILEKEKHRKDCTHWNVELAYHPPAYSPYSPLGILGGMAIQGQQPMPPPNQPAYWSGLCNECGSYLSQKEILAKLNENSTSQS